MQQYKLRNVTEDVKKIVRFAQEHCEKVGVRFGKTAQQNRLTMNMLVDIFIGKTPAHTCEKVVCNFKSRMMFNKDAGNHFFQGLNLPRYR